MELNLLIIVIFHAGVCLFLQIVLLGLKNVDVNVWFNDTPSSRNINKLSEFESQLHLGSSVWCYGSNKSERFCKFRNLCYHPVYKEYLFFHGNKTTLYGIPEDRFSPALLDMSSIDDHNTQYFNFVDFPSEAVQSFKNITFYKGISYIFHRFKSENIMHVIHDDLLPLFQTMKLFSSKELIDLDSRLVFMEGWNPGPYFNLYKICSSLDPLLKQNLTAKDNLKCFEHAVVGISKFTTWYQYGFKQPQGPLPTKVSSTEIKDFTTFVKQRLGLGFNTKCYPYVVMIMRQYNRLVLNEKDISMAISKTFGLKVVQVSLTTHTFSELVAIVSNASALVGMHGSALILSMFLPAKAVLLEMFPFGINPDNYLPYKTLSEIPGMNLIYASWRNTFPGNTVTHPDDAPEIGGIRHLPKEDQEEIEKTIEVPPHICCSNPFWLYRIYQDTLVDKESFLTILKDAFNRSRNMVITNKIHKLVPSKVIGVTCVGADELEPALFIKWKPPINIEYFVNISIKYEVWIQKSNQEDYTAYMLPFTQYVFKGGLESKTDYRVWVRCIASDMVGSFAQVVNCITK